MKYFYGLAYIVTFYILFILYFKWRNRFWSTQPVFFYHQLWNWIFPRGLIHPLELPLHKNKFYTPFNVKTITINSANFDEIIKQNDVQKGLSLIQNHYLRENEVTYKPKIDDINVYLKHHNGPCFISYYYTNQMLYEQIRLGYEKNSETGLVQVPNIHSILSCRPLYVSLDGNRFITNYVDFLTTHKKHRKKGYAPRLINTFAYHSNQYYLKQEKEVHSSYFFKNEAKKASIVPFVVYSSYFCDVKYFSPKEFNPLVKLTIIDDNNMNLFTSNFQDIISSFTYYIHSDIANLECLIREKQIFVFCSHQKNEIFDWYFFRRSHVEYKEQVVWEFFGSCSNFYKTYTREPSMISFKTKNDANTINPQRQLFINHFYNCIDYLKKNENMSYLNIESISHNDILLSNIIKRKLFLSSTHYNYYFYNFIYHPQKSQNVLILT